MTAENKAKAQYTFDTIAAHLLVQGVPSMAIIRHCSGKGENMACAYRGDNGLRCAVGFCIPNENYTMALENKSASNSQVRAAIGPQYCNDGEFLDDLQEVHDASGTDWATELKLLAKKYRLDASIVDTVQAANISQPQALAEIHA